jgi:hypothetical protein
MWQMLAKNPVERWFAQQTVVRLATRTEILGAKADGHALSELLTCRRPERLRGGRP